MPLLRCQIDNRPGWKWGPGGHCYAYDPGSHASEMAAKRRALAQGIAIGEIDVSHADPEDVASVLERAQKAREGL